MRQKNTGVTDLVCTDARTQMEFWLVEGLNAVHGF